MKTRITFRMEVFVEGKDINDVTDKWEGLNLHTKDVIKHNGGFIEVVSVEDMDTGEDITNDFGL